MTKTEKRVNEINNNLYDQEYVNTLIKKIHAEGHAVLYNEYPMHEEDGPEIIIVCEDDDEKVTHVEYCGINRDYVEY